MSCIANKSEVCIKISFAASQMQQMVEPSLEKYENNVMHFTNSPSISLCFKRLWLKTIYLPIDYHVTMKKKYVTSNELSIIPNFTPSHHIYHKTLVSLYYSTFNFSQRTIQSVVNSSLKYKKSHSWLKQNICIPGTEHSYTYIGILSTWSFDIGAVSHN